MTATSTERSIYVRPSSFDYGSADGNGTTRAQSIIAQGEEGARIRLLNVWPSIDKDEDKHVGCRAHNSSEQRPSLDPYGCPQRDEKKRAQPRGSNGQAFRTSGCCGQQCRNRRHTRPSDGADCRKLRQQGPSTQTSLGNHCSAHEARIEGDAGARTGGREHRQCLVGLWKRRCCRSLSVYVASKHAIEGLTKSAALEVAGTGVRVNVVAPGTTDTGMLTRFTTTDKNKAALVSTVPFKRLARPEEIAHVIAFVASENAVKMIGASIPVDGGMIAD